MSYIVDPRVLQVLDGQRAIVSTRGKRRVVIEPGNEVLAEFVGVSQAATLAAYFNDCHHDRRAVVVKYAPPSPRPFKSERAARYRSAV